MHELFKTHGTRGAIFLYDSEYAQHGKFFVILNAVWPPPDGVVVYAYATSRVDRFADGAVPESMFVRLEQGQYSFCTKPTVIDLTAIKRKPQDEFARGAFFKFVCLLSDLDIARVEKAVAGSSLITRRDKKAILGQKYG